MLSFQNDIDVLKKRRMIKYFFTKYYAFYDGFPCAEFHAMSGPRRRERFFCVRRAVLRRCLLPVGKGCASVAKGDDRYEKSLGALENAVHSRAEMS